MNEPLLVSRAQAAKMLCLSQRSLDLLIKTGKLAHVRAGRKVLVPISAVRDFAERGSAERIRPA